MIPKIARALAFFAAVGWLTAIAVSIAAFSGVRISSALSVVFLTAAGVAFACAVVMQAPLAKQLGTADLRNALWKHSPVWLTCLTVATWGYGLVMITRWQTDPDAARIGFAGAFLAMSFGIFWFASDATRGRARGKDASSLLDVRKTDVDIS